MIESINANIRPLKLDFGASTMVKHIPSSGNNLNCLVHTINSHPMQSSINKQDNLRDYNKDECFIKVEAH